MPPRVVLLRAGSTVSRIRCASIAPPPPPPPHLLQLRRPVPSGPARDQPRASAPFSCSSANCNTVIRAEASPVNRRSCLQRARACHICRATRPSPLYGRFVACAASHSTPHLRDAARAPLRRVYCRYSTLLHQPTIRYIYCAPGPVHNVGGAQIAVRFPGYGCVEKGMTRTYVSCTTQQPCRLSELLCGHVFLL